MKADIIEHDIRITTIIQKAIIEFYHIDAYILLICSSHFYVSVNRALAFEIEARELLKLVLSCYHSYNLLIAIVCCLDLSIKVI